MKEALKPMPIPRTLRTPGVYILLALLVVGLGFALCRFIFGLAAVTNLDQHYPWGLWIAVDVATGVALAAGGFVMAAMAYIFHRKEFGSLCRPALLTAALGYTFVVLGLLVDLGRYYNIWHPLLPSMQQGNSVLFEVAICVVCYVTVLYLEFLPIACERLETLRTRPRLALLASRVQWLLKKLMFLLIIAGVVLSCLHQSSLGSLMLIAPSKVHPLWWTPILPLLFLLSAVAVGFAMVICESSFAAWSMGLPSESHVLARLTRYVPPILGAYLAFKIADILVRGAEAHVVEGSTQSLAFGIEILFGVALPMGMLTSSRLRASARWRTVAAVLIVLGVALNRINVFLVAYLPPNTTRSYFPAIGEFAVTIGLIAGLILVYRVAVTYLPVISQHQEATST